MPKAITTKTKKSKKDLAYEIVTDKIMSLIEAALEDGSNLAPWHKPWNPETGAPRNMVTGKPYRGINSLLFGTASGFNSPFWLSFKQIDQKGGSIIKGSKATYGVFFKWNDVPKDANDRNKWYNDRKFRETFQGETIKVPYLRYFKVFNLEQTTGIEAPVDDEPTEEINPIDECETILAQMKDACTVKHGGNRAFYSPGHDYIQIPEMKAFQDAESYYATRFHETVHSTGHESRLGRSGITDCTFFGTTNYSKEELVAEMGAAFLCGMVGIDNKTAENSAAYLRSWLKKLKDDKKMLVSASYAAQKAVDFIVGTTFDN